LTSEIKITLRIRPTDNAFSVRIGFGGKLMYQF